MSPWYDRNIVRRGVSIWFLILLFSGGWEMNAGIDFLEFKPSEIAAAVAISVAREAKPVDPEKAIPLLIQQFQRVICSL